MNFDEFLVELDDTAKIVAGASEFVQKTSRVLVANHLIQKRNEYEKKYETLKDTSRLLKIGILGRVNAGKSTFLNALLFEGKGVLPTAATPMTAALTVLEYSKTPSASAEPYDKEDLTEIKAKSQRYKDEFKRLSAENFKLRLEKEKKLKNSIDERALRQEEETNAETLLKEKEPMLHACFEQQKRIEENKDYEFENLKEIHGNLDEIRAQLKDFVGESGKFMPYTKAITLKVDNDFLKDMQIIDTPGLNDPMPSRSKRTNDFLQNCDIAFVLSLAGQFFHQSDSELFDKLANKSGTAKIVFVALKADKTILESSVKQKSGANLDKALKDIASSLDKSLKDGLKEGLKDNKAELKNLQERMPYPLIITSSMCANIDFVGAENLDENSDEKFYLKNLQKAYPNDFDKANLKKSLQKLANVKTIKEVFADTRKDKEKTLQKALDENLRADCANLQNYKSELAKSIKDEAERLETSDVQELTRQIAELDANKNKAQNALNSSWDKLRKDFTTKLKQSLIDKKTTHLKSLKDKREVALQRESETYTHDKGSGLFWWRDLFGCRYETRQRMVETTLAGNLCKEIEKFAKEMEILLKNESKERAQSWQKTARRELLSTLKDCIKGDYKNLLDKALDETFGEIKYPQPNYASAIPSAISGASGKLKGYAAREFLEAVDAYFADFEPKLKSHINAFITSLENALKKTNLGERVLAKLIGEIQRHKKDLGNKTLMLDEYSRIYRGLMGENLRLSSSKKD